MLGESKAVDSKPNYVEPEFEISLLPLGEGPGMRA
jgi:hypothetical protein